MFDLHLQRFFSKEGDPKWRLLDEWLKDFVQREKQIRKQQMTA